MAAFGIAAPLQKNSFKSFGETLIDGSDRTADSVSWRMRVDDKDGDSTFFWIEVNRRYGQFETARMLRKIAANRDCSAEGGILFLDFKIFNGLAIPRTRHFVNGLDEKPAYKISLAEFKWNEAPDTALLDGLKKKKADSEEDEETDEENEQ